MKAFLFGAGASHSYNQSPTGVAPPLAGSFFPAFRSLDIAADRFVRVGSIINYVRDTRGLDPIEFGSWTENIEDFLTEIDERIGSKELVEKLSLPEMWSLSQAYDQMIFLFACVLNEIQNGPVCKNYKAICDILNKGDQLITFNWDTLLDRSLFSTGNWFPEDGYAIPFSGIFRDGWSKPANVKSSFRLLKLHGSTNWLMPYLTLNYKDRQRKFANPTIEMSERPVFCFESATKRYETYHNRSVEGYEPFSYYYYPPNIPIHSGDQAPEGYVRMSVVATPDVPEFGTMHVGGYPTLSMPLIIPPVRHKQYGLLGNALDPIWDEASAAIANCDELTIVGYSFPQTDTKAWLLLKEALAARDGKLNVTLVDPFPENLAKRLLESFDAKINLNAVPEKFDKYVA